MISNLSVKDIEGSWVGDTTTGLIERLKQYWETPINELPDIMLATYLNQKVAINSVLKEAERRIQLSMYDDSELFDGQLKEAVQRVKNT